MTKSLDFPFLGYGVGLRPPHYSYILDNRPDVGWFEIISENYMDTDGKPRRILEQILEHYPVIAHGVSLSIGTVDPLNSDYLKALKDLIEFIKPAWVSDHLCWTGVAHKNTHDLLPVPYTEQALKHVVGRIKKVQDYLGRPIVLENPSTYLEFTSSSIPEWEFIARMADDSGCGLLLDANNIYVSCYNHRWDPQTYIDALPLDRVAQIHLAGHMNKGTHIIDTHNDHVIDEVWTLYNYVIGKAGREITTMVEWDADIPDFPVVYEEVQKAKKWAQACEGPTAIPAFPSYRDNLRPCLTPPELPDQMHDMQDAILSGRAQAMHPEDTIVPKPDFSPEEQIGVYINGYRHSLFDAIGNHCPALRHYLGPKRFSRLVRAYIKATPSTYYNLARYIEEFPAFVKDHGDDEFSYELAVLEMKIVRLFDDRETPALSQDDLETLTPDRLMESNMKLRSAATLLAFSWPVNDYYNEIMAQASPAAPEKSPSYVAVYRHDDSMWRLALDEDEYLLLASIHAGMPLEQALDATVPQDDDAEDLLVEKMSGWFSRWVSNGLISTIRHPA